MLMLVHIIATEELLVLNTQIRHDNAPRVSAAIFIAMHRTGPG
jgi:hypothetical protein